jgi:circadian clock protein KaiB
MRSLVIQPRIGISERKGIVMDDSRAQLESDEFEDRLDTLRTDHYLLRLYVTGTTVKSRQAIMNIQKLCEEYLEDKYELEVIDIYQQPELAKSDQIIAAPTLIKQLPLPFRRLIGDLSNVERVLAGLSLKQKE